MEGGTLSAAHSVTVAIALSVIRHGAQARMVEHLVIDDGAELIEPIEDLAAEVEGVNVVREHFCSILCRFEKGKIRRVNVAVIFYFTQIEGGNLLISIRPAVCGQIIYNIYGIAAEIEHVYGGLEAVAELVNVAGIEVSTSHYYYTLYY